MSSIWDTRLYKEYSDKKLIPAAERRAKIVKDMEAFNGDIEIVPFGVSGFKEKTPEQVKAMSVTERIAYSNLKRRIDKLDMAADRHMETIVIKQEVGSYARN